LKVRPHRLRHWHATALLESGADVRTVQECMRHVSPSSTAGYMQVTETRRAAAVARLPRLNQPARKTPEPDDGRLGRTAEAA
jgi:site-specific recombinase XerD